LSISTAIPIMPKGFYQRLMRGMVIGYENERCPPF
jgi:hypothetical protein